MRNKILKSVFTIGMVVLATGGVATQAAFTDTVLIENNTFTTGNAELKLFYDCQVFNGGWVDQLESATYQYTATTGTGAIVNCPANDNLIAAGLSGAAANGAWEQASLLYSGAGSWFGVATPNHGSTIVGTEFFNYEGPGNTGDWTIANGWWDALSSPQDWTNVYPGWNTFADTTGSIEANTPVIAMNEGDFITFGNAGTVPLSNISMLTDIEIVGAGEANEPEEGLLDTTPDATGDVFVGGGDRIDPLSDAAWVTAGKVYDGNLATQIYVRVDRMNASGVEATVYNGTLAGLDGVPVNVLTGTDGLEPDEVVTLRFNWEMDSDATNAFENLLFDYNMNFTGTT